MISPQLRILITSYFEDIKKLKEKPKRKYKIALFLTKDISFIGKIKEYKGKGTKFFSFNWQILKEFQENDELLVRIKLSVESKRSGKIFDLKFLLYEKINNFLMLITDFNSIQQDKVYRFLDTFYPMVSRFYLIHSELFEIIKDLEKKYKYELYSSWYIISEKFGKRPDKDIKYRKGIYFEECFLKARTENKFVEKIRLDNLDTFEKYYKGKPYDFKISREGELTIFRGKLDKFYLFFIENILSYAYKKYGLLKDRSRIKNITKETKPIIIEFYSSPFKEKEGITILQNTLKKYPNCSYAIIHSGNPFLEMIFVDYSDNSSFSLFTFSNRSLIIYPQLHASEAALLKLFSFITKRFSDGELYDYEEYKQLKEI